MGLVERTQALYHAASKTRVDLDEAKSMSALHLKADISSAMSGYFDNAASGRGPFV